MAAHTSKRGFSILEMAISITIIALLVATVTAAKSLKTRLELNQVIEDISNVGQAVKTFQSQYSAIPGDMFNATSTFGSSATTNGNGDNDLADGSEAFLFWQHLALAGMIEGTYDGSSQTMTASMKNGIFTAVKASGTGALYISASKSGNTGLFTTKQAFDFDSKFDDGSPETGSIRTVDATGETAGDCINTTPNPDVYNLANTSESPCVIQFYLTQ